MEHVRFYSTLTDEERTRAHPCKKTRCVMMAPTDDSSPAQASISTRGLDVLDDARLNKFSLTSQPTKPAASPIVDTDADAIEEAVPIVQTKLPVPESEPKIEKNGIERKPKKPRDEPNDECLINCIYYTQQCCDCTIV
ncbi:PREDICTED: uncharacterized protein LOC105568557 isoform X4 [Vollenhovia emeryi]|uniref:uncharacterized protein LOC105568557 isoform X4 n=1 Tax=Vollenhovia emeryi TaxID=411798 RepID=UPI0005F54C81|nr:PREDICTED: uncharacterized protein LOC105568557 isoform X4 [Vollenhovia emeryi]XP_011879715.1 PREDICTED: uncharacterized protein LOC105568557 isoform X4 [Vollenhovia emeryi]XP_011879716.1 PREDICTED: uncharacterized protein LOC105568557 isoform X4 [Vollenhovia emeryi]